MKIKTPKYEIYVDGGQVYKDGKYFRPLTEEQIEIIKSEKWATNTAKKQLDKLIDENFENYNPLGMSVREAMKELGYKDESKVECYHSFLLVERLSNNYIFACKKCLELRKVKLLDSDL